MDVRDLGQRVWSHTCLIGVERGSMWYRGKGHMGEVEKGRRAEERMISNVWLHPFYTHNAFPITVYIGVWSLSEVAASVNSEFRSMDKFVSSELAQWVLLGLLISSSKLSVLCM